MKFINSFIVLFAIAINLNLKAQDILSTGKFLNEKKDEEVFSRFNSNYFLFGLNDLKLQLSFKYNFLKNYPVYFGYTQLMFWNIYIRSLPFREINYEPTIFYRFQNRNNQDNYLDLGSLHRSNGVAGYSSRSYNVVFISTQYKILYVDKNIFLNFDLFKTINEEKINKSIEEYIGYWKIKMAIMKIYQTENYNLDLEVKGFAGKKVIDFKKGSFSIGLMLRHSNSELNPAIYLETYHGYAEKLIDFDSYQSEVRIGLLISY